MITLKAARVNKNLRLKDAAEAAGVSRQTIIHWEAGTTQPLASQFLTLCKLYGADPYSIKLEVQYVFGKLS